MPVGVVNIDLIEIQSTDVKEVIKHKIEEARKYEDDFIVEDTALYLGLNKEIGALIKWIPNEVVVKAYKGQLAIAVCCIGQSNGTIITEKLSGEIVEPRGENGFGWDRIFQPIGFNKTLAEMTDKEKNRISHRYRAIKQINTIKR